MKKEDKQYDEASTALHQELSLKERIRKVRRTMQEEKTESAFPKEVAFLSVSMEIFCGILLSFLCCWGVGEFCHASILVRCISGLFLSFCVTGWSIYKKMRKIS